MSSVLKSIKQSKLNENQFTWLCSNCNPNNNSNTFALDDLESDNDEACSILDQLCEIRGVFNRAGVCERSPTFPLPATQILASTGFAEHASGHEIPTG